MDILKRQKAINNFSKKTMNDQKDSFKNRQKIGNSPLGQDSVFNHLDIENKEVYSFVIKKTEKIVTALYMVTDCMDTDDAIKMRMRLRGVDLLSSVHQISVLSPAEKHAHLTATRLQVGELLSLVDVSLSIGFISRMNAEILKREFLLLIDELVAEQAHYRDRLPSSSMYENRKISDFVLSPEMFNSDDSEGAPRSLSESLQLANARDLHKGQIFKKTSSLIGSQNKNVGLGQASSHIVKSETSNENSVSKKDRSETIKNIIKDKGEVSIKDISVAFSDCSEKTIQRELNDLISKGQIKKIGEKRWSRYSLV
jgi:hypothetical protein